MATNIGFVSTHFAGTDSVSLEANKWSDIIEKNGNRCFWFAGKLDKLPPDSFLVPEAHAEYAPNIKINAHVFGKNRRDPDITRLIHTMRSLLKTRLYHFIDRFKIDMLIVENALAIPIHIPLGLALAEVIAETQIPAIAHHYDFYWEGTRFSTNAIGDYLRMAFPPNFPNIRHVVINPVAQRELSHRAGISATIIPNVIDFDHPPSVDKNQCQAIRRFLGLAPGEKMILQPARVVQKKEIAHAIELVRALRNERYKLVVSHEPSDERLEYKDKVRGYASERGVDLRFIKTNIRIGEDTHSNRMNFYSMRDLYATADLIAYPGFNEGFGNAFMKAVYFKKPILINRHETYIKNIELKRFDLMVMEKCLTREIILQVEKILGSPLQREKTVTHNYRTAARYYSYHLLKERLVPLITQFNHAPVHRRSTKMQTKPSVLHKQPISPRPALIAV